MTTPTPERVEEIRTYHRRDVEHLKVVGVCNAWEFRMFHNISDLLSAYDALSRDGMREALVKMRDRDDRNGSLPAWYRAEIDAALSPDAPRQKEDQYHCECVKCGKPYVGAKRSSICLECKSDAPEGRCTKCGGGHGSNESCSGPPRPSQPPKYIPRG